jgi:hypothetical protein
METSNYFKAQIFGKRRNKKGKKKKCKAGKTRRVRGSKTKTRFKDPFMTVDATEECPAGYAIYGGAKRSYT